MTQAVSPIPASPAGAAPALQYAGFWVRFVAAVVDSALALAVMIPLLKLIYGRGYSVLSLPDMDALVDAALRGEQGTVVASASADSSSELLQWALAAIAVLAFWISRQATPGKMLFRAKIVDARTGRKPSAAQLIGRYFSYYLSIFGLGLGFLWVAFDPRKQGWHDKLAGTVVVRPGRGREAVRFVGG
jgi:uncharacterized RDD family membrane protein YckC